MVKSILRHPRRCWAPLRVSLRRRLPSRICTLFLRFGEPLQAAEEQHRLVPQSSSAPSSSWAVRCLVAERPTSPRYSVLVESARATACTAEEGHGLKPAGPWLSRSLFLPLMAPENELWKGLEQRGVYRGTVPSLPAGARCAEQRLLV